MTGRRLLYAPNVHTGGGFVLLQGLLAAWPGSEPLVAFLDARAHLRLKLPAQAQVRWVRATAASRWAAERALRREAHAGDRVLCFHGLPPLLRSAARVVVFQQNRNYLGLDPLSQFAPRTALRLAFERGVSRLLRHRVDQYIVQTPTMARELLRWWGDDRPPPAIRVLPFADAGPTPAAPSARRWDFVYVSDGEAHKNHRRLLQAWQLLAAEGLRPSLALTLSARDGALADEVDALRAAHNLAVENLGPMTHAEVFALYASARALVFASTSESFGLPLVEAHQLGLPVLAPEADYVRDVCEPVQTFDPLSPVSIARAVRRFLGVEVPPIAVGSPAALWAALDDEHGAP